MIPLWKEIFLALLQGGAEIFPVSSSGHLSIFSFLLDLSLPYDLIILFHSGTFLAILIYYKKDAWQVLRLKKGWKFTGMMAASFIFTAAVGFGMKALIAHFALKGEISASYLLALNGVFLVIFSLITPREERLMSQLRLWEFILVGVVQGITALPGISRLGMTLGVLLLLGVVWFDALKLSFLLSLPTIFFSSVYTLLQNSGWSPTLSALSAPEPYGNIISMITIFLITFAAGSVSLRILSKYMGRRLLLYFGMYCSMTGIFFSIFLRLF